MSSIIETINIWCVYILLEKRIVISKNGNAQIIIIMIILILFIVKNITEYNHVSEKKQKFQCHLNKL